MKKYLFVSLALMLLGAVLPAQSLTLTSPNGGQDWAIGGPNQTVSWTYSGYPDGSLVKLVLFKDAVDPAHKLGNIVENISIGAGGRGSYSWVVGSYDGGTAVAGSGYYIRVIDMNGTARDESDQPFRLSGGAGQGADLEVTDIRIGATRSLLSARVRSNLGAFRGWVVFRSHYVGPGAGLWTDRRELTLSAGGSDWVNLRNVGYEMFEETLCGRSFEVRLDSGVTETNTENNVLQKRLYRWTSHDGSFFPNNHIGPRNLFVERGSTVRPRREDVDRVTEDSVTLSLKVFVRNCGGDALRDGALVYSQSWTYTTSGGRLMDGGGEIARHRGINLDAGEDQWITHSITLTRRESKVNVHFDCDETGAVGSNNDWWFTIDFSRL